MITTIVGNSMNDLFGQLLQVSAGWQPAKRRGGAVTYDSPGPVVFELLNPRKRVLSWPGRNNSLPAAAAETLWVLAGRDDIGFLQFYLPRAKDFSDDGEIWRAAYGPRLRGKPPHTVDQLKFVVEELIVRPTSRRALITLHSPAEDAPNPIVIDWPCNVMLSFMVREGKLDLLTVARSQDALWGLSGINVFEFTVLQELVAMLANLPLGSYYHVANNLHYYEKFKGRFERMRAQQFPDPSLSAPSFDNGGTDQCRTLTAFDHGLEEWFRAEQDLRSKWPDVDWTKLAGSVNGTLFGPLNDLAWSALAYAAAQLGAGAETWRALSDRIIEPVMRLETSKCVERVIINKRR